MMDNMVLKALAQYDAYANQVLLDTIAELDEEALRAIESPSRHSAFALIRHYIVAEAWFLAAIKGETLEVDREHVSQLSNLRELSAATGSALVAWLDDVSAETLQQTAGVAFGSTTLTLPRWQILLQSLQHAAQHRGELSILLSGAGKPLPIEDIIMRFVRDSGQQWG